MKICEVWASIVRRYKQKWGSLWNKYYCNATQDIGPIGIELAGVLNHSMPTVPSVPLKSTP